MSMDDAKEIEEAEGFAEALKKCAEIAFIANERTSEMQHALQCLAFAIGKQEGSDAQRFRDDFLKCAELFWPPGEVETPVFVKTLLQQHVAGELHRKRGID